MNKRSTCFVFTLFLALASFLITGCSEPPTAESPTSIPATTAIENTSEPTVLPSPTSAPPPATSTMPLVETVSETETVPESTAVPAAPTAQQETDELGTGLIGLSIDEFFAESFDQLSLRSPESLTEAGVSEHFGMRNDQLDNLSNAYILETQELEVRVLELLREYDRESLTHEQQVSYDVYEWHLDNLVRGHEFTYHNYPIHHMLGSYHDELMRLFTEIQPLENKQDAEDYISRLSQVDVQVQQLMEGLNRREGLGVIPPRFILEMARSQLIDELGMRSPDPSAIKPDSLAIYTVFAEKLAEIAGLSDAEKQALLDEAMLETESSFIPAFIQLLEHVDQLLTMATDDAGVWKLPDGDAYYTFTLRDQTSTDLEPQEIHQLGLAEVERIQAEMRQVFDQLGYPSSESFTDSMDRAMDEAGYYSISSQGGKDQYVAATEALIEEADQTVGSVFDKRPQGEVVVIGGPWGGYYVPGTADGSRPGAYHVSIEGTWRPKYSMPTIAYHEAIPGHHFQIALAQEMDLPTFRNHVYFNGFGEGWALYAERLGWELGLYENDPYGDLGRLQFELLRAVRLVTDTGIHSLGWTRQEARQYMDSTMGGSPGSFSHEVDRYVVLPAQATGYKIGMLKILELRQKAMDELGEQFDIKEFHNIVLGNGSLPLEVLEDVVDAYIEAKLE